MIVNQQLLGHLTIMIKTNNSAHRGEINIEKAVRINATNVTDRPQHLPG